MNTDFSLTGLIACTPPEVRATGSVAVALTGVDVHARVQGPTARVRVRQRYENREAVPIEATYVFPLSEGVAVCGFSATIDGHRLAGVVKERDAAFDDYDDAMAEGISAFLLDQERPDIFTASVGNLLPGQSAELELQWVAELTREGEGFRLSIPSTVSPRYVPEARRDAEGMSDAERINPPTTTDPIPYGLKLVVDVDLLAPLHRIESPSHKIRVELDGARARVELAGDEGRLDRDVVFSLVPGESASPLAAIVSDERGDRFAVASLTPSFEIERAPVDAIFVIDCSGSMEGPSIQNARETLRLGLRGLHPGDRFEILRFGSTFERLFGEVRDYGDDTMQQADDWLKKLHANLGGTEILSPLAAVLSERATGDRLRRIVLITDGQVANEDEVIHLVRKHRDTTRMFTFGVGHGASEHLVRGAARASGGAAEMVAPGESIEAKVMRQLERLAQPAIDDLRLDWEGIEATEVIPHELDAAFSGETITVYARVLAGERGSVTLSGRCGGTPWRSEIPLEPTQDEQERGIVPLLWARHRIRDLEGGSVWTGLRGSQQRRRKMAKAQREREAVQAQLVELGTRYGLLSAATSYVVIDDRPDAPRAEIPARLRQTPTALTRGWHGSTAASPCAPLDSGVLRCQASRSTLSFGGAAEALDAQVILDELAELAGAPIKPKDADRETLLRQHAEGYWDLDAELSAWARVAPRRLRKLAKELGEQPVGSRIVATLLVLHRLEARPDGVPDSWTAAIEKARKWIREATVGLPLPDEATDWQDWIARSIP